MRFTDHQYAQAIEALQAARQQLEPDGNHCSICTDSGHMAWECGFNPLVAVALCVNIAKESEQLHETLHYLAGFDQAFGVQLGPRKCVLPEESP